MTASRYGPAAGRSGFGGPADVIADMLWDTFEGAPATRWGNAHEKDADAAFRAWFPQYLRQRYADCGKSAAEAELGQASIVFSYAGLIKFSADAWMGASPDGFVTYLDVDGALKTDLIEYKCPYWTRDRKPPCAHPYSKYNEPDMAPNVPPQYGCQVQGVMGYLNAHPRNADAPPGHRNLHHPFPRPIGQAWFAVWIPRGMWVTLLPYDDAFYRNFLLPRLKTLYFTRILPAMVHKENGLLAFDATRKVGDIAPRTDVDALLNATE
jgi:hypothetical protein